jgi:hypothetical protein
MLKSEAKSIYCLPEANIHCSNIQFSNLSPLEALLSSLSLSIPAEFITVLSELP